MKRYIVVLTLLIGACCSRSDQPATKPAVQMMPLPPPPSPFLPDSGPSADAHATVDIGASSQ